MLKNKIPVPIHSVKNQYKTENEYGIYLLYHYIEGHTIGNQGLTQIQINELANIVAQLHSFGQKIPFEVNFITEKFENPFLNVLSSVIHSDSLSTNVKLLIIPYMEQLERLIDKIRFESQTLKSSELDMVLCHTDLHNWNFIDSNGDLIIIDWEGLKLAPVEADMIFFIDKPYFNDFMEMYKQIHPNYSINETALSYYQNKRYLEDIWEFIEQLEYDNQNYEERKVSLYYLENELQKLAKP